MWKKDFVRIRIEATQTLVIRDFIPARAIDVRYFDEPYYLAPAGKPAARANALRRAAQPWRRQAQADCLLKG